MALDTLAQPTHQAAAAVEPSRAWILGLVVESDGSVSGPASERALEWPSGEWVSGEWVSLEWPAGKCPFECATDHEHA